MLSASVVIGALEYNLNVSGLWAVVNNAGIVARCGPIDWLTKKDFEEVIAVNLLGVISVTQAFLPLLRKGNGRLINMSSGSARFACVSGPYVASKFGVEGYSDTLRLVYYHYGNTPIQIY